MSDIVLSKGIRGNLLSLQSTSELRDRTQTRLATGKRVNNALDNPTNFFNAASLNGRAADIGNLLDAIGNAVKTIEAADNGIRSITRLIESAQATARQAIQSAGTTARLNGTAATSTVNTTVPLTANTNLVSALGMTAGNTVTINDGTATTTFTLAAGSTVQNLLDAINTGTAAARASLTADGRLLVEATGTTPLTIGGTSTAAELGRLGFAPGNTTAVAGTSNLTRQTLASQFSELRRQMDQLSRDAGFNGVNLLNGDTLQVLFNERQTSSVTITGVRLQSSNDLALPDAQNGFQTDKDINDALTNLQNAMTRLRAQASTFGANLSVVQIRQKFTQETINTLKTGADNLTIADINEESANMLALQTRQQLSTQALSLANQADQGVLRLFG